MRIVCGPPMSRLIVLVCVTALSGASVANGQAPNLNRSVEVNSLVPANLPSGAVRSDAVASPVIITSNPPGTQ